MIFVIYILIVLLGTIAMLDARHRSVPTVLLISLVLFGLVMGREFVAGLLGFIFMAACLVFWTALLRRFRMIENHDFAMGWADPVVLGGIGLFMGTWNLSRVVWLASIQGLLVWLLIPSVRQSLPLASFLCLAAIEMILFSNWYLF